MSAEELEVWSSVVGWLLVTWTTLSVVSTSYLWIVWFRAEVYSTLYVVMASVASMVTVGGLLTLWPVFRIVLDLPRLDPPWTLLLVGAALLLAFSVPVLLAVYVYRVRHRQ